MQIYQTILYNSHFFVPEDINSYILYTVHSTQYTVHSTQYTVHCKLVNRAFYYIIVVYFQVYEVVWLGPY